MSVRPYPFERWPRIAREDVGRLRRCARHLPLSTGAKATAVLTDILGAPVAISALPFELCPAGGLLRAVSDPLVAAVISEPARPNAPRFAMELAPDLAGRFVDRILGGDGRSPLPPVATEVMGDMERGVIAYLWSEWIAASEQVGLQLAAVVTSPLALAAALGEGPTWVWPARLEVGTDVGIVRAWLPAGWMEGGADPPRRLPAGIASVPIDVAITAGHVDVTIDEARSLRAGDVVLLDDSQRWLAVRRHPEARWPIRFVGDDIEIAGVAERGRRPNMIHEHDLEQTLRTVGEAPLRVIVELGRFELRLEELAALRPGEILRTGAQVGERVTLQIAGRSFARGELVDIEGEVGVRVTELWGATND